MFVIHLFEMYDEEIISLNLVMGLKMKMYKYHEYILFMNTVIFNYRLKYLLKIIIIDRVNRYESIFLFSLLIFSLLGLYSFINIRKQCLCLFKWSEIFI